MDRRRNVPGTQCRAEVFVASSEKNVGLAYDIQQNLDNKADVTVWDQGVFKPSRFTLEQLVITLNQSDFGVFIFAPDDITEIKGRKLKSVRDNVIFELGLFIGKLGRERCFIVTPRGQEDLRLPSDLAGLAVLTFNPGQTNTRAALGPACHEIGKAIGQLGVLNSMPPLAETELMLNDVWVKVSRPAPLALEKLLIGALPKQRINWVQAEEVATGKSLGRLRSKSDKRSSRKGGKSK